MPARVLLVEDHPASLELMSYLLRAFGHRVLTATTGEGGVDAARREQPDLVVCDVQLPGIDGLEVARRLKTDPTLARIPLVAVSAFAMVGDRERVLAARFDGYVPKPIDPEAFVPTLEAYLPSEKRAAPRDGDTVPAAAGRPEREH